MKTMRVCKDCSEEKPIEKFAKLGKRNNKQRIRNICLICDNKRLRKSYWENVENSREKCNLKKKKYVMNVVRKRNGWTEELYLNTLKEQNYKCALCGSKTPSKSGKVDWHADHNHKTGKARGILCAGCNTLLGKVEKNGKEWFERAEEYINLHS